MKQSLAALGLLLAAGVWAQDAPPRPEFDVASIRPAPADRRNGVGATGGPQTGDPTHIRYRYFTLHLLLMTAYDMTNFQVSLPPALENADRYDVEATLPPGTTQAQARTMLQNFLIDRFHLKLHRETRVLPLYELTAGKNGPKLKPHDPSARERPGVSAGDIAVAVENARNHMYGIKVTTKDLTRVLGDDLATPVVDKTGLTGEYDFDFAYSREGLGGFGHALDSYVGDAPTLQTALQEALGLKLESKKGPLDMVVVDSGDKTPSSN